MRHTLYYDAHYSLPTTHCPLPTAHYSLPTAHCLFPFLRLLRHECRHRAVLVGEILLRDALQIRFVDLGVVIGGCEEFAIIAEEDLVASERIGLAADRLQ